MPSAASDSSSVPMASALGGLCFLPFMVVLLPVAAFVALCVPETRGKSVTQILFELSESPGANASKPQLSLWRPRESRRSSLP